MQLSRRTMLTSMVAVAAAPKWSFAAEAPRTLVVYYSYMGHTKSVAEKIRTLVSGELFEIPMAHPYPLDLQRMAAQSKYELETGELPPLSGDLPNVSDYDLILVGGPVWWNTVAPPVMSFLEKTDFMGRKVGLFGTYALAPARYERSFAAQTRNAVILSSLMISEFDVEERRADSAISSWAFQGMPKEGPQAL
ncbi:flavodoxin [Rhizobium rhizogenes]|uniref:flavodoxin n=1 Tax=Rhizobium rhizogenes TaxID=359 RepID=UPI0015717BF6|nr:flavodoxin [Rhizobium rhizogenes]NTF44793.1 flavodoxin [Rhizobium rhizogenes]